MGDLIPIIEGPVKFRDGKKVRKKVLSFLEQFYLIGSSEMFFDQFNEMEFQMFTQESCLLYRIHYTGCKGRQKSCSNFNLYVRMGGGVL